MNRQELRGYRILLLALGLCAASEPQSHDFKTTHQMVWEPGWNLVTISRPCVGLGVSTGSVSASLEEPGSAQEGPENVGSTALGRTGADPVAEALGRLKAVWVARTSHSDGGWWEALDRSPSLAPSALSETYWVLSERRQEVSLSCRGRAAPKLEAQVRWDAKQQIYLAKAPAQYDASGKGALRPPLLNPPMGLRAVLDGRDVTFQWATSRHWDDGVPIPEGIPIRYRMYRDGTPIFEGEDPRFADVLPSEGPHRYYVTASVVGADGVRWESERSEDIDVASPDALSPKAHGAFETPFTVAKVAGAALPQLSFAESGGQLMAHLAFVARERAAGLGDLVQVVRSTKGGRRDSWSLPLSVVTTEAVTISDLSLSSHRDRVVLAWIGKVLNTKRDEMSQLYLLESEDGGLTWPKEPRVVRSNAHPKRGLALAHDVLGALHAVWGEAGKIYYTKNFAGEPSNVFDQRRRKVADEVVKYLAKYEEGASGCRCPDCWCEESYAVGDEDGYVHWVEEYTMHEPSIHVDKRGIHIIARRSAMWDNVPVVNPLWQTMMATLPVYSNQVVPTERATRPVIGWRKTWKHAAEPGDPEKLSGLGAEFQYVYNGSWHHEDRIMVAERPLVEGAWSRVGEPQALGIESPDSASRSEWREGAWVAGVFQKWRIATVGVAGGDADQFSHPQVRSGANGRLYAVYERSRSPHPDASTKSALVLAHSDDGGQSWSEGLTVGQGTRPKIASTSNTVAVLAYHPRDDDRGPGRMPSGKIQVARTAAVAGVASESTNAVWHTEGAIHGAAHAPGARGLWGVPALVAYDDLLAAAWVGVPKGGAGQQDIMVSRAATLEPDQIKTHVVVSPSESLVSGRAAAFRVEVENQYHVAVPEELGAVRFVDGPTLRHDAQTASTPRQGFPGVEDSDAARFASDGASFGKDSDAAGSLNEEASFGGGSVAASLATAASLPADAYVLGGSTATLWRTFDDAGGHASVVVESARHLGVGLQSLPIASGSVDGNYARAVALRDGRYDSATGAQREFLPDPTNEDSAKLAEYARVWVYTQGIALAQAARRGEKSAASLARWLCDRAVRDPRDPTVILGWHFSHNTVGDGWKDFRLVTGASAWAVHGLGLYVSTGGAEAAFARACYQASLRGLLRAQTDSGLLTAGYTAAALETADGGEGYYRILDRLGYDDDIPRVRATNVVTEHNVDALQVLNHALHHREVLGLSEDELVVAKSSLKRAIFTHLWDPGQARVITGGTFDAAGAFVPSRFSAVDNCSWLSLSVDYASLTDEEVKKISACLHYTIKAFVKELPFGGDPQERLYLGTHYFPSDFRDPYIDLSAEDQQKQPKSYHLEATAGVILGLWRFAENTEHEDVATFRRMANTLWAEMQRFVRDHDFPYSSQRIHNLSTQLQSSTAAIWFIDVYDHRHFAQQHWDRPLKTYARADVDLNPRPIQVSLEDKQVPQAVPAQAVTAKMLRDHFIDQEQALDRAVLDQESHIVDQRIWSPQNLDVLDHRLKLNDFRALPGGGQTSVVEDKIPEPGAEAQYHVHLPEGVPLRVAVEPLWPDAVTEPTLWPSVKLIEPNGKWQNVDAEASGASAELGPLATMQFFGDDRYRLVVTGLSATTGPFRLRLTLGDAKRAVPPAPSALTLEDHTLQTLAWLALGRVDDAKNSVAPILSSFEAWSSTGRDASSLVGEGPGARVPLEETALGLYGLLQYASHQTAPGDAPSSWSVVGRWLPDVATEALARSGDATPSVSSWVYVYFALDAALLLLEGSVAAPDGPEREGVPSVLSGGASSIETFGALREAVLGRLTAEVWGEVRGLLAKGLASAHEITRGDLVLYGLFSLQQGELDRVHEVLHVLQARGPSTGSDAQGPGNGGLLGSEEGLAMLLRAASPLDPRYEELAVARLLALPPSANGSRSALRILVHRPGGVLGIRVGPTAWMRDLDDRNPSTNLGVHFQMRREQLASRFRDGLYTLLASGFEDHVFDDWVERLAALRFAWHQAGDEGWPYQWVEAYERRNREAVLNETVWDLAHLCDMPMMNPVSHTHSFSDELGLSCGAASEAFSVRLEGRLGGAPSSDLVVVTASDGGETLRFSQWVGALHDPLPPPAALHDGPPGLTLGTLEGYAAGLDDHRFPTTRTHFRSICLGSRSNPAPDRPAFCEPPKDGADAEEVQAFLRNLRSEVLDRALSEGEEQGHPVAFQLWGIDSVEAMNRGSSIYWAPTSMAFRAVLDRNVTVLWWFLDIPVASFSRPEHADRVRNTLWLRRLINQEADGDLLRVAAAIERPIGVVHHWLRDGVLTESAFLTLDQGLGLGHRAEGWRARLALSSGAGGADSVGASQAFDFDSAGQPSPSELATALRTMTGGLMTGRFKDAPPDVVAEWGGQVLLAPSRLASRFKLPASRWLAEVAGLPKEWILGAVVGLDAAAYLSSAAVDVGLDTILVSDVAPTSPLWERVGVVSPEAVVVQPAGTHFRSEDVLRAEALIHPEGPILDNPLSNPGVRFDDQSVYLIQMDWLGLEVPLGHFGILTPSAESLWPVFKLKTSRPRSELLEAFVHNHKFWQHIAPFADTLPAEERIAFLYIVELMIRGDFDRANAERLAVGASSNHDAPGGKPAADVSPKSDPKAGTSLSSDKVPAGVRNWTPYTFDRRIYGHFKHGVLLFAKKYHGDMKQLTRFFQLIERIPRFNEALDDGLYVILPATPDKKDARLVPEARVEIEEGRMVVVGHVPESDTGGLLSLWRAFVDVLVADGLVWAELAPNGTALIATQSGNIRTSEKPRYELRDEHVFIISGGRWLPKTEGLSIRMHYVFDGKALAVLYHTNKNVIERTIDTELSPSSFEFQLIEESLDDDQLALALAAEGEGLLRRIPENRLFLPSVHSAHLHGVLAVLAEMDVTSAAYTVYELRPLAEAATDVPTLRLASMQVQRGNQGKSVWFHFLVVPDSEGDRLAVDVHWDHDKNNRFSKEKPAYVPLPILKPEDRALSEELFRKINNTPPTALDERASLAFLDTDVLTGLVPGVQLVGPMDASDSRGDIFEAIESDYLVIYSLREAVEYRKISFPIDHYWFAPVSAGHSLIYTPDGNYVYKLFFGYGVNMGREDFADAVFHEVWHELFFSYSPRFRAALFDRFHAQPYFQKALAYLEVDPVHFSKKNYEERFATEALSVWSELLRIAMRQSPDNPTPFHVRGVNQERAMRDMFARAAQAVGSGQLSKEKYDNMVKQIGFWNELEIDQAASDEVYALFAGADPERILNAPFDAPELDYQIQPGDMLLFSKGLPPFFKEILNQHGYTSPDATWQNDAHAKKVWDELSHELRIALKEYFEHPEDSSRGRAPRE